MLIAHYSFIYIFFYYEREMHPDAELAPVPANPALPKDFVYFSTEKLYKNLSWKCF